MRTPSGRPGWSSWILSLIRRVTASGFSPWRIITTAADHLVAVFFQHAAAELASPGSPWPGSAT